MDINNAFDEILKIQDKLDKTNAVNPKITVNGKEYTLYHEGNKPSASDVGALSLEGNTKHTTISGKIYIANSIEIIGLTTDGSTASIASVDSNNKVTLGGVYKNTNLQSYSNPTITLTGNKTYTLYHEGNKPSASDVGANTTLFSGIIGVDKIESTCINKNNCVDSSGVFTIPETGTYLFIGLVKGLNSLFATRNNSSSKITIMDISNYAVGTDECLPFSRALNLNAGSQFTFSDSNGTRSAWTQLNIIKLV